MPQAQKYYTLSALRYGPHPCASFQSNLHSSQGVRDHTIQNKHYLEMANFEIRQEDVVIAVMGPTGAGKSSFVRAATGDNSVDVGHTLQSGRLKNTIKKQILRAISDAKHQRPPSSGRLQSRSLRHTRV